MAFCRSNESRQARGYGRDHIAERNRWVRVIERGEDVRGHFCGQRILRARKGWPGDKGYLHLDHTPDRNGYRGPACAGCNLRDAARRARARQLGVETSRPWRSRVW